MKLFIFIFLLFVSNVAGIACPKGFSLVNQQKCLKIVTVKEKHIEAEVQCSNYGGTLVRVKNAIDNRAVTNFAANSGASPIWLGVYCFTAGTTINCYHDDNTGVLSYNNFASGNPKIQGPATGCVTMTTTGKNAGIWQSSPCEVTNMAYVCEVPTTQADAKCTRNYNGYCYTPSFEMKLKSNTSTWAQAQAACQTAGANLVSIHSKPEIDFIRAIYRNKGIQDIFIGAQATQNVFNWADGSNMDYDYSDPLSTTNGDCLAMDLYPNMLNNGLWFQTDCARGYQFLCKRKIPVAPEEEVEHVNPKFQMLGPEPPKFEQLDFSNCNTTMYFIPGLITSYGFPSLPVPKAYCSWRILALGPYRVGLYFTSFSTTLPVNIMDEYGSSMNSPSGDQTPFLTLAPTNLVTITHDSKNDATGNHKGFTITLLPY